ncbi:MAG: hypothetical protein Q9214_006424, partial [Letrouitia sp. 1 TL-2023]
MQAGGLTYLGDGVYDLEKGNNEGHLREGDLSMIRFGCTETEFDIKELEEGAEFLANNQHENEESFKFVDERGDEQELAKPLVKALSNMSKGQKLLIDEKNEQNKSHTGGI